MTRKHETRRAGGASGLDKSSFPAGSDNRDHPPNLRRTQAQSGPCSEFDPARKLFTVTLGDSKSCQIWKHRLGLTWNELVKKLSESPAGPKDGPAYTPA